MSWAEVKKINSNMSMPLDEMLKQCLLLPPFVIAGARGITVSASWTPPRNGKYRVICVGQGGAGSQGGSQYGGGGGGGVVIKDWNLLSTESYPYEISPSSTTFNINNPPHTAQIAFAGTSGSASGNPGKGGGGSGGVVYKGEDKGLNNGGSVGIFLNQLSLGEAGTWGKENGYDSQGGHGGHGIFGVNRPSPSETMQKLARNGGSGADFGGGGGQGAYGSSGSSGEEASDGMGGLGGIIIQFLEGG